MVTRVATPVATLTPLCRIAHGSEPAVTRVDGGGSKQTRTADPFLVREVL